MDDASRMAYTIKVRKALSSWQDPWHSIVASERERRRFETLSVDLS